LYLEAGAMNSMVSPGFKKRECIDAMLADFRM
jgi:hypothetical protein